MSVCLSIFSPLPLASSEHKFLSFDWVQRRADEETAAKKGEEKKRDGMEGGGNERLIGDSTIYGASCVYTTNLSAVGFLPSEF